MYGYWGRSEDNKIKTSIYGDPKECVAFFKIIKELEKKHDKLFEDHAKMEVFHEDSCRDSQAIFKKIEGFLGVKKMQIISDKRKYVRDNLSKSISNYYQLKKKMKNTVWIDFFDD